MCLAFLVGLLNRLSDGVLWGLVLFELYRVRYICGLLRYHLFPYKNDSAATGVILSLGLVDLLFILIFMPEMPAATVFETAVLFS